MIFQLTRSIPNLIKDHYDNDDGGENTEKKMVMEMAMVIKDLLPT